MDVRMMMVVVGVGRRELIIWGNRCGVEAGTLGK